MVIVVCAGGIVWMRRRRGRTPTALVTPGGIPHETFALEALTHGNSGVAEGKCAEALAALHQARELDPKRPHVADRRAAVDRRQHAASAMSLASATV